MRYLLTVFAALVILATGSTLRAEEVPGVSDDRILVGMTTDLTGPLAFAGQQVSAGARLYLQHVNEQGGVHGRRIDLLVEDDGYQPPRTVAAFRKLLERDGVFCFAGNLGSVTTMATLPLIERERVPVVMPCNFNSRMATPFKRYVFAVDPNYMIQSWLIAQYIAEIEKADSPRLAAVYQDDDLGQDGLKGLRQAAAHYGLPLVVEEGYKRGAVDFSAQVLNMKKADPTHVVLLTVYREGAAVMEKARQAGWKPQFIGWLPATDGKTVELAGEAAEGFLGLGIVDLQSDAKEMVLYRDLLAQYTPGERPAFGHTWGFGMAQTLVEGLWRVGRDLTREKLVEALETLERWDGSVLPPVTYGPDLRGGRFTSAFVTRADVEGKKMVRISDWLHFSRPVKVAQSDSDTR